MPKNEIDSKDYSIFGWDNAALIAQKVKWESTWKQHKIAKLNKSLSDNRKEIKHWVRLLVGNLRKITEELNLKGEKIELCFKKEKQAR